MSQTIQELYLKYVNSVGGSLEDDRYFRYLFEIIQAGNNELRQNRQILHKVVDEEWISIIEDTLDSINSIIEKPRRFVARMEEIVPVSLAKKITADSVRHLSMNTQFIASAEGGEIQPTRILNVSNEDSYDLYENRFVYHLIQKLVVFIDKRTDIIFWSTGDEIQNTMTLESKIDDAYEQIEYKIEMKIKDRQSFAENDADNMDTFMRIDRIRRLTMALRTSAFCELMSGCQKVRSPIQRTNLLMKDPDYRKCYNLWQFLERYEGVGYIIEEKNTAMEFDEEYLLQMYINLINNYIVFKSLSDDDSRNLDEATLVQHKKTAPKFIKEIREEVVDDYDLPDVEVRQVIIEEVTQAQLDAEAKADEERRLRDEAYRAKAAAEAAAEQAIQESQRNMQLMMEAQERALQAEDEKAAALAAADKAIAAREKAEREAAQTKTDAETAVSTARRAAEEAEHRSDLAMQEREAAFSEREIMAAKAADAVSAMTAALAARSAAEQQAEEYHTALNRTEKQLQAVSGRAEELSGNVAELSETANRSAARISRLEKELTAEKTASEEAAAKMRRAVAARREAESIRAAAEKKSEALTRTLEEAEKANLAEQEAMQLKLQELEDELSRTRRALEQSRRKLESRSWLNHFGRKESQEPSEEIQEGL